MNKRFLSAIAAICLGGITLALLILLLAPEIMTSRASPAQAPADADLTISVQAADETVLADETILYTLLYTNASGLPVDNVIVAVTLQAKQFYSGTYLSTPIIPTASFTYSGDYNGYTLEWQWDTLAVDAAGSIIITTTLNPDEAEPTWSDTNRPMYVGASAGITTSTPGVTVEPDSATVMVVGPVLRITKTDDPGSNVRPGHLLTYTITVENKPDRPDAIEATGIVITDTLPENTAFYTASATGLYSPTSGLVIWHPGNSLPPASTMEVSYTVRVSETLPTCSTGIKNIKYTYVVGANETIRLVTRDKDVSTSVANTLEKIIETPDPPSDDKSVFPGGTVTYTISVHNPSPNRPITNSLRLTDTFESDAFIFVDMLPGGPTPVITSPHVVWDGLSLDAGGMISFSFHAWVPYHIDIGSKYKDYDDDLSASAPGFTFCDMDSHGPSRAKVTRQIILSKDVVQPDFLLSGGIVTYTITAENVGDTEISSIRLTDTLPYIDVADFHYVDRVYGPDPVYTDTNTVVWDNLTVSGNSEITLSFHAKAIGWPLIQYGNDVSASSPWTTIPGITNKAQVTIDSPLTIDKVVNPSETFVGGTLEPMVTYAVTVCNVSSDTYRLDRFVDVLPVGFYEIDTGNNIYEHDLDPDPDLAPGACWTHEFEASVTKGVGCANLPATIKQGGHKEDINKAAVRIEVTSPIVGTFFNTVDLAPLRVNPHVRLQKEADHAAVLPGETFVYTITLINDSGISISGVDVVDTLPDDGTHYFDFVEMVVGEYPTDDTEPDIVWENQTILAGGQLVLAFRVLVPEGTTEKTYKNSVAASTLDQVCIESIGSTAGVKVIDPIVKLTKNADPKPPNTVPPYGIVVYEIKLENRDSVDITGVVVTDTLPEGLLGYDFEFSGTLAGPEPSEIGLNGRQIVWRDLTIPGDGNQTLSLEFEVRATIFFGTYYNQVSAWCPRNQEIEPNDPGDVHAPVLVEPGPFVYKTASPTETVSGSTVIYAITLDNPSGIDLDSVRITDTLPDGFSFLLPMIDGPAPIQLSPLVWTFDQVRHESSEELVFRAKIGHSLITGTYSNTVEAHTPSAIIAFPGETAPVYVTPGDWSIVYLPLVLKSYTQ